MFRRPELFSFDVVFPELLPEGRPVNPEHLGGGGPVVPAMLQRGPEDGGLGQLQEALINSSFQVFLHCRRKSL
jgi:hypothetical protein